MSSVLKPQNSAEQQFVVALEAGQLRLELVQQKIEEYIKASREAVSETAPEVAPEQTLPVSFFLKAEPGFSSEAPQESIPESGLKAEFFQNQAGNSSEAISSQEITNEEPLTAMPFAELAALLAPKGINLQQQLDEHVGTMVRMNIVPEKETDAYRAKFQTINVRKSELKNIPKGYRSILFVDNMTPVQAAERFITSQNIDLHEYSTLADFTKRDPKTPLKLLKNQSPSGLARLTFTPNVTNLPSNLTGKTPDSRLDQMKQGKKFMEPTQWFQIFAECLERAMKELNLGNGKDWKDMTPEERKAIMDNKAIDPYLPDATTWTQSPDYRNQFGDVLNLDFDPDSREVGVDYWHPSSVHDDIGSRPSLG